MAAKKRKKKKAVLGKVLKFEIYGILLITFSIIALSGEAAVGRTLSKMSALMLGKFYFVIPLIGIYVGLLVMIHRKWPSRWNSRLSGVMLGVLACTLMSTIYAMSSRVATILPMTMGNIIGQIHADLQQSLLTSESIAGATSMMNLNISGGYVGAIQYAILYKLFGNAGAKLILIVMLSISFMLITNLSYVDLLRILRTRTGKLFGQFNRRMQLLRPAVVEWRNNKKIRTESAVDEDEDEDDEIDDLDSSSEPNSSSRTKPVFFQLFGFNKKQKDNVSGHDDQEDENQELISTVIYKDHDDELHGGATGVVAGKSNNELIIRDFFDQIRREERPKDELDPDEIADMSDPDIGDTVHAEVLGDNIDVDGEDLNLNPSIEEGETEIFVVPKPAPKPYKLPSFRLLSKPLGTGKAGDQADYMQTARKLEATLESFGVRARVLEVVRGPAVTRYEIQPDIGVKVSRIVSLTDDIALALAAKDIRMEAPIPGKSAIGIEVPNSEVSIVTMREVMETPTFQEAESKLSIAFGRDISGQTIVGNLAKMPHLLVAGATGSGKSVCINGIITSILYKAKPDEVKFLMVDPKMVELNVYNGIPHLLAPVVTDPRRASLALKKIVVEMEKRYELFSKSGARNVEGYNNMMKEQPELVLPYIVVIVDELADLMMVAAKDVEDAIARLAQMARAAGIHLIIATQRPSVDVITGVIKANIPSRIAFGVSSQVDSRTILDMAGAEKLLGRGDMLFMPMGASKPIRVQGAFMSDQEVESIVHYVSGQAEAEYDETLIPEVDDMTSEPEEVLDELYDQAVQIVLEAKQASVSLLQRRMRVGYTRAARLIDSMEARGVVGPYEGSKPREVLMSKEQYQQQNKISS